MRLGRKKPAVGFGSKPLPPNPPPDIPLPHSSSWRHSKYSRKVVGIQCLTVNAKLSTSPFTRLIFVVHRCQARHQLTFSRQEIKDIADEFSVRIEEIALSGEPSLEVVGQQRIGLEPLKRPSEFPTRNIRSCELIDVPRSAGLEGSPASLQHIITEPSSRSRSSERAGNRLSCAPCGVFSALRASTLASSLSPCLPSTNPIPATAPTPPPTASPTKTPAAISVGSRISCPSRPGSGWSSSRKITPGTAVPALGSKTMTPSPKVGT
jgi:hypothetical protein